MIIAFNGKTPKIGQNVFMYKGLSSQYAALSQRPR